MGSHDQFLFSAALSDVHKVALAPARRNPHHTYNAMLDVCLAGVGNSASKHTGRATATVTAVPVTAAPYLEHIEYAGGIPQQSICHHYYYSQQTWEYQLLAQDASELGLCSATL